MILAIETSSLAASVAVSDKTELIAYSYQRRGLTHSRTLMPMLGDLLKNCGLTLDDISMIAVSAGPGSFTGLRIGIAAAKGLAWPRDIPCCPISTLEAMVYTLPSGNDGICCVMDARAGQVYNALFSNEDGAVRRLCPDRAISISELAEDLRARAGNYIMVGDGAKMCYNELNGLPGLRLAPPHLINQNAAGVALAAALDGHAVRADMLRPAYLRLPQAERERLRILNTAEKRD